MTQYSTFQDSDDRLHCADENGNDNIKLSQDVHATDGQLVDTYIMEKIVNDYYGTKSKNDIIGTSALLFNFMIGSGILSQPYSFKVAGILTLAISYFIVSYVLYVGTSLLVNSADCLRIYDYQELVIETLGSQGEKVLNLSILINSFGALLAYFVTIGSLAEEVTETWFADITYFRSYIIVVLSAVFIVLPLCLVRHFGNLVYLSYLSIFAITMTIIYVIFNNPTERIFENRFFSSLHFYSVEGVLKTVGTTIFTLNFTQATLYSFKALKTRNAKTMNKICLYTYLAGIVYCILIGFFGYCTFRQHTRTIILENYSGVLASLVKCLVILHLLLYIPGDFFILRDTLNKLLLNRSYYPHTIKAEGNVKGGQKSFSDISNSEHSSPLQGPLDPPSSNLMASPPPSRLPSGGKDKKYDSMSISTSSGTPDTSESTRNHFPDRFESSAKIVLPSFLIPLIFNSKGEVKDSIAHVASTITLLSVVTVLAVFILLTSTSNSTLFLILNLSGVFGGSFICFIFPALISWSVELGGGVRPGEHIWWKIYLLISFGATVLVAVPVSLFLI